MKSPGMGGYTAHAFGPGEPVANIFVGVHGDEHAPIAAAARFVRAERSYQRAFRIVVCNVRAVALRRRFVQCDLNRAFPGDAHSDLYEQRLAHALLAAIPRTEHNLDLHTTSFPIEPYGIVGAGDEEAVRQLPRIAMRNYVVVEESSLISCLEGAQAAEIGFEAEPQSVAVGCRAIERFLHSVGCLTTEDDDAPSPVVIHQVTGLLVKSEFSRLSSRLGDFVTVHPGDWIGDNAGGAPVYASELFTPIWVHHPSAVRRGHAMFCVPT